MAQKDFGPFNYVQDWKLVQDELGWWHTFELPDGRVIKGVNSIKNLRERLDQYPIPDDLRGKRVLDIGAWDGWFSFEMERRGAQVVAIDNWDNPRFREMHAILGSKVEYLQMDVYELTPERVGRFDIVLFLGVLYHLKHPLLALERICALTTDFAVVDSFILQERHRKDSELTRRPLMEFYETSEFGGQTDNWVGPTLECLTAFCRTAGFARVDVRKVLTNSACLACYRRWAPASVQSGDVPLLLDVFHHTDFGINVNSQHDDYVNCWFDWPEENLTLDDVLPQVSEFGVRPIDLRRAEGHWQANLKVPPGLAPGWHPVQVRIKTSGLSNGRAIAVDMPLSVLSISISSLGDGRTWEAGQVDLNVGNSLALWVTSLPANADRNNVTVFLAGKRLTVTYVESTGTDAPRQINVTVPDVVGENIAAPVVVQVGGKRSASAEVRIVGRRSLDK